MTMQILTPVAVVRKRPGMYVGDTNDGTGMLHLLLEVVANSVDQHLAGRCTKVAITVSADGTITVVDDGPGMSAKGGRGLPPLDFMLSRISNRATVDGHRPHIHLGIGGLGLFVANALSERFELRSVRAGKEVAIAYERGDLVEKPTVKSSRRPSGTTIRFRPDPTIFQHARVPRQELARRLEDLTFLLPALAFTWTIDGDDIAREGIAARLALAVPCALDEVATHADSYVTSTGPVDASVAIAWRAHGAPSIESFVNYFRTSEHGVHVDGLMDGVRKFLGARKQPHDAGLTAVVHVVLADVQFGNPSKNRLVSPEARRPVADATVAALEAWAERHPERAADIRGRVATRRRAKRRQPVLKLV